MSTPDRRRIIGASLASLLVALILLVTLVLPAEYGWDPLGTGAALGLLGMSEGGGSALHSQEGEWRKDSIEFTLSPFEAVEYKYRLEAGDTLLYHWRSNEAVVFDMHAEPDGAAPGFAESFEKSQGSFRSGSYRAPFAGIHGWFWQNRSQTEVTVTLQTRGFFSSATEFRDGREFEYRLDEDRASD